VGLSIAALACPPFTVMLGVAAWCIGLLRESFFCFEAQANLDKARKQLVEDEEKLKSLANDPLRVQYHKHVMTQQKAYVKALKAIRNERNFNCTLSWVAIAGVFLLIPPFSAIGLSIVMSVTVTKIAQQVGLLGWCKNQATAIFCKKEKIMDEEKLEAQIDRSVFSTAAIYKAAKISAMKAPEELPEPHPLKCFKPLYDDHNYIRLMPDNYEQTARLACVREDRMGGGSSASYRDF